MVDLNRERRILILGNGFDLAHGLPTRYSDFLDFCNIVMSYIKDGELSNDELQAFFTKIDGFKWPEFIKSKVKDEYNNSGSILRKIKRELENNIWYKFFYKLRLNIRSINNNWVDFENEIRRVIEFADRKNIGLDEICSHLLNEYHKQNQNKDAGQIDGFKLNLFGNVTEECFDKNYLSNVTVGELRKYWYDHLENFIKAFNLYLAHFVDSISAEEIKNFAGVENIISRIEKIKPDYVLNFNYTHTYEKLYPKTKVFHIHGECKQDPDKNNIVLGIDQYWQTEEERQEHVNYAIFKKYVQRIRKRTGNKHRTMLNYLRVFVAPNVGRLLAPKAYVFGHSLNKTDKDILADFFNLEIESAGMKEDINITVFYHDKETEGELIANMVSLIGEEKVLEKSDKSRLRFIKLEELNI